MSASVPPEGEFELIARHFQRAVPAGTPVELGIGDDCALLDGGPDRQWAITTDTLIEGTHFFADVDPEALGHKALAVNLSDLAACGAQPRACLLALALPQADASWLSSFARGFFALADRHGCVLAGGDTTRSPAGVHITITAFGEVPRGAALLRSGARPGDDLWVSGRLGDGALGLAGRRGEVALNDEVRAAIVRYERPEPRVGLGLRLRGIASAAIDVSDGLAGDLGHLLARSGVAAALMWGSIPRSPELDRLDAGFREHCVFAGGDDYELLFAADPTRADAVRAAGAAAGVAVCRIGTLQAGHGLTIVFPDGRTVDRPARAFDHFRP